MDQTNNLADAFINRWIGADGSELANAQSFTRELCELLGVAVPDPAQADTRDNAYVFERHVNFNHADGTTAVGRIDVYRRAAFVLENKKLKQGEHTKGFGVAMLAAYKQAEQYVRALPAHEGRPPFLMVVDVGNMIEIYAEFSCSGGTYTPFPDPRSHRIKLDDLRDEKIRDRLKKIWLEPQSLDPAKQSAKVTREIAAQLAEIAKSLESAKYDAERVGAFLTRCLFTFFAEDVGLLPKRAFTELLQTLAKSPEQFVPMLSELWHAMDKGTFSVALRTDILHFNGKLFKNPDVLPLNRDQITLLVEAGSKDWSQVEPAIFGTLLERALNPTERHSLGAHYTPRSYVERLVLPTVIEPLREEWGTVQTAALTLASEGNMKAAETVVRTFQLRLCSLRILDPACGSGNFLYVTLEHLKRLEGEVLNQLQDFNVSMSLETEGLTVDPHQFLGIELNPRAASIAEMVLWIGYLQWHFKTKGAVQPPQPVLRDFKNIECRDAVLTYDSVEILCDEHGIPVTRWDGKSFKKHPVTGEDVPDEAAQSVTQKYINPRKAEWPKADFVVGNPPFIGTARMIAALGEGYVSALRTAWKEVPESSDLVMFWWHKAGELLCAAQLQRFGFITTNSLRQTFNRRVLENQMNSKKPLSLVFAIPDHPWVDNADGAAVRIAMTVAEAGEKNGVLSSVMSEVAGTNEAELSLARSVGKLHADLRIGADLISTKSLLANNGISNRGFCLFGAGFLVSASEAEKLAQADVGQSDHPLIFKYRNGRDLTERPRGIMVLDAYGLSAEALRQRYPSVYQWLVERVKPERDNNKRESRRLNWWIFGEPNKLIRHQLGKLTRYIATVETAKHRIFQFLESAIAPDNKLI
ncbi:MAG: DNA methyltransferase, partial [Pseudomonadota bacterium]